MDCIHTHAHLDVQLFVDDWLLESTQSITRRWHQPQHVQNDPIIKRDQPWEHALYFTYSNFQVKRDPQDGLIKCWYEDNGPLEGHNPWKTRLCYAVSRDGIHFEKPVSDQVVIDGQPTNVLAGYVEGAMPDANNPWANSGVHSAAIVIDPDPPTPDQRFRMLFSDAGEQPDKEPVHTIHCAHSPDGLRWIAYPDSPSFGSSGSHLSDVSTIAYDDDSGLFVQMTRHGLMYDVGHRTNTPRLKGWNVPVFPHEPTLHNKRRVFRMLSKDFIHWTEPTVASLARDDFDNLDEQHYGMGHFRVGRHHFGTLGVFQQVDNTMNVRLVHSRDGHQYEPLNRGIPFLEPRGEGHWDRHMVSITSPPIEMGDDWIFYHGGSTCHHDYWMAKSEGLAHPETHDPHKYYMFGLGAAKLRKNGFASLEACDPRPGVIATRPMLTHGKRLAINARCKPGGSVRVAIADVDGHVQSGYTHDDADVFTGDSTHHVVTWHGNASLANAKAPRNYRKVHFYLDRAEIYSFTFLDDEKTA